MNCRLDLERVERRECALVGYRYNHGTAPSQHRDALVYEHRFLFERYVLKYISCNNRIVGVRGQVDRREIPFKTFNIRLKDAGDVEPPVAPGHAQRLVCMWIVQCDSTAANV